MTISWTYHDCINTPCHLQAHLSLSLVTRVTSMDNFLSFLTRFYHYYYYYYCSRFVCFFRLVTFSTLSIFIFSLLCFLLMCLICIMGPLAATCMALKCFKRCSCIALRCSCVNLRPLSLSISGCG